MLIRLLSHSKPAAAAARGGGAAGLVSKRRGRPSRRRIGEQTKQRWIDLIRQRYPDFGPTLACEHLVEHHAFAHSRETLRGWMIEAGLWQDKPVRRKRVFQLRPRCPAVGELVQIDGSPHAWLEDRALRCTLIIFVDDATSALRHARFVPAETTRAYLRGLHEYGAQRRGQQRHRAQRPGPADAGQERLRRHREPARRVLADEADGVAGQARRA
jgi:hypothetical protein